MSDLRKFNETITRTNTQSYLQSVLGDKKNSFITNLTSLVANNINLQACEPLSLMYAGIKATALDLPLDQNLGFAYVIPYKNTKKGIVEAQFQIGYKGFIQLSIRSGQFQTMNVVEIREGELIHSNLLTGEISFKPMPNRESLPIIGYASYFRLTNGFEKTLYSTVGEVMAHAKRYSQTFSSKNDYVRQSSTWSTDFDEMAKKTVLKSLLAKYAPMSIDMQTAIRSDQAVITEKGDMYLDNPKGQEDASFEDLNGEEAPAIEEGQNDDMTVASKIKEKLSSIKAESEQENEQSDEDISE